MIGVNALAAATVAAVADVVAWLRRKPSMINSGKIAELYFTEVLWPDFTPEHLNEALEEFARRERRYGGR